MQDKIARKVRKKRDPEGSKSKIKEAVGTIIREQGYTGLKITNIAKVANVAPSLITYYFDTVDNLIGQYLAEKDYWLMFIKKLEDALIKKNPSGLKDMLYEMLLANYDCFHMDNEMQKVVTWELSEYSDHLRHKSNIREVFGAAIFTQTDPFFKNTEVEIRAEMAIMMSGIYYIILHAKENGSTFCGIDINKQEGKNAIFKSIHRILSLSFQYAEETRKDILGETV